ncbi:MAG: twin-arginine translocase subunit TatC [Deltaproteobacteria bacterium]|nr:twin-arginine translocase subunit TatC [Deltaproteobacteria bacterium]MBZ0219565.1 twin-arginine translocase subunit TatC [Deltaproteobacteria bacterium]
MTPEDGRMSFTEHLGELRRRLIYSVAAVAAGFLACYYFSERLYWFLASPLIRALPEGQDFMVFTGVVEPFFIYLKVALLGGIITASPVVLYQTWAFIAPGLYRSERRWFIFTVFFSVVLFAGGAAFAFGVVFPFGFKYLLSYSTEGLKPFLSMGQYFSIATRLLVAFGLVFQLPLAILVLSRLGLVSARQLVGWWRYALVLILIASAVITPTPDIFNQMLMAGPLAVLYGIGIIVAWLFGKKKEAEAQPDGAEGE